MKKALSFAVALGLVAGAVAVASAAELTINGDARWRGVYHTNYTDATEHKDPTLTDPNNYQDTVQEMDQRYRLNVDLKVNDDVKINTRMVLADQIFGDNYHSLNVDPGTEGSGSNIPAANNFYVDRANMVINTLGGEWTIGRQDATWGNKFVAYGVGADRIKATYDVSGVTLGAYLEKVVEGQYANGDGDEDIWGAFAVGKVGDTTGGVLLNYITYDGDPSGDVQKGDTGYLIDPYFVSKIGPATVLGEAVYMGGDLIKHSNFDKSPFGGFVAAAVDFAPVTVKGLVAYFQDNSGSAVAGTTGSARDCDNDFAPSLLIGTCNETAMIDFGTTTNPDQTAAHADDRTYLVGAGVDFKATDKITVGALVGYLGASKYMGPNNDDKGSLTEVDVTGSYELAQNATYKLGVAYGKPKNFSAADDNVWAIGNSVEVTW